MQVVHSFHSSQTQSVHSLVQVRSSFRSCHTSEAKQMATPLHTYATISPSPLLFRAGLTSICCLDLHLSAAALLAFAEWLARRPLRPIGVLAVPWTRTQQLEVICCNSNSILPTCIRWDCILGSQEFPLRETSPENSNYGMSFATIMRPRPSVAIF